MEWVAFPTPGDLPDPGIKPGSPALQTDSLPTELSRKTANAGDADSILGLGRYPEVGKPVSAFFPGEFHGQRSLVGYSLWSCKELDMIEHGCTTA